MAVSYTHLDVYKRQYHLQLNVAASEFLGPVPLLGTVLPSEILGGFFLEASKNTSSLFDAASSCLTAHL